MMSSLPIINNDWPLIIHVTDLNIEKEIRVNGTLHIGGCIIKLINALNIRTDWSDYALWWPTKKQWLLKTKYTLDQYNIQANEKLKFTPIHKSIRLELPDLQQIDFKLNFSINLLQLMQIVCKNLGIRHFEELSLLRDYDNGSSSSSSGGGGASNMGSTLTLVKAHQHQFDSNNTTGGGGGSHHSDNTSTSLNDTKSIDKLSFEYDPQHLAMSPLIYYGVGNSIHEKLKLMAKYKSLIDKAKVNSYWLDSSKSLMEQDIHENDVVKLRFKYYAFYDLNIKYDLIRINQIYEQAKWSILSEEIDCTDAELVTFAALQLQIYMQTKQALNTPSSSKSNENNIDMNSDGGVNGISGGGGGEDEDDVDAALNKLEKTLMEQTISTKNLSQATPNASSASIINDLTQVPELCEELFLMKHKYTFKKFKTYYFVLRDTYLSYFKSKTDYCEIKTKPIEKYNLKNCEITPDLNVLANKYGILMKIFQLNDVVELYIRCLNDESYAKWLAAFKLASKNKTLSDTIAYQQEISAILNLIEMQKVKKTSLIGNGLSLPVEQQQQQQNKTSILKDDFQVQNFVTPSLFKKIKTKQLNDRIIEAHSNMSDLSLIDAKLRYIKTWQALPEYGITYFVVRIKGSKYKEEVMGVTSTRLIRYSNDFKLLKQWRLNAIKTWSVNWDTKQFNVEFDDETLYFQCLLNLNPKILNEFIGAYIFLSLRTNTNESNFNHDLFFELTSRH